MLLKIGYTKHHPQDRGLFLRKENYGNVSDWDIKKFVQLSRDAGKKEFEIHAALEKYQKIIIYKNAKGALVECREIFNCDLEHAIATFHKLTGM